MREDIPHRAQDDGGRRRAWVDDCLAGKGGPRGRDFNMCWLGAVVVELHRILRRDGLFFYAGERDATAMPIGG